MVVEKTAEKRKTATKPPDRTNKKTVEKASKTAKKAGEKTKRTVKKTVEGPREEEQTEATQPPESREALIARDIEREKRRLNAIVQEKTSAIVHSQMREEETSCVIFSQYEE